jgi:hypothetical protein
MAMTNPPTRADPYGVNAALTGGRPTEPEARKSAHRVERHVGWPPGMTPRSQPLGVILPANDCATILPSRTTNVSVPTSYTLSAVSAVHKM